MKNLLLSSKSLFTKLGIFILLAGLTFAGCDTVSENSNRGNVAVQFQTVKSNSASGKFTVSMLDKSGDTKLKIEGTNGTLIITDLRFIVDDFELERADGKCDETDKDQKGDKDDKCEEFESELIFVDLPLENNESVKLSISPIRQGSYAAFEFEIDNLDIDEEEDKAEKQRKQAFLTKIQSEFGYKSWPESASMVISGSFVSNRGNKQVFFAYADAEVSMDMEISPPLEIDNNVSKLLSVKIDPVEWFTREDGSVINFVNYDYPATGKIYDLEVEVTEGFENIEVLEAK